MIQTLAFALPTPVGADIRILAGREQFVQAKSTRPEFLDFFAGSGLVSHALKSSFDCVWANDISVKKAAVYAANHGSNHFTLGSIEGVRGADLPTTEMMWASFPCQDLSLAGATNGIHAPRSGLVWQWLRIVDEMHCRPPVLVAENVVGLIATARGAHYRLLHRALAERGYAVGAIVVDASMWLPQSRVRVFVIAVDKSIAIPQTLVATSPGWLQNESMRRASAELDDFVCWNATPPQIGRSPLSALIDWDAPFPAPEVEARNIALIAPHHRAILDAIPAETPFVAPGYRRTRNGVQTLELRFDDTAGCLRTPEGGSSRQLLVLRRGGRWRCRLLTAREAARLMGAPENYQLPERYNDAYMAMGDAVAVPVVDWLGKTFLRPLVDAARAADAQSH